METIRQEKILEVVIVNTDEQLLGMIERARRGIRTYPAARDRHQQTLHDAVVRLSKQGKVRQVRDHGSSVEWALA